jgi:plastocyanin
MSYSLKNSFVLLFSLAAVQAANFDVNVGQGGFVFSPDHVSGAAAGDTVTFHFFPVSHTVTQGSLDTPCTALSGGFNSGP